MQGAGRRGFQAEGQGAKVRGRSWVLRSLGATRLAFLTLLSFLSLLYSLSPSLMEHLVSILLLAPDLLSLSLALSLFSSPL